MSFQEGFPYSNQHTLNLDWVLKTVAELEKNPVPDGAITTAKIANGAVTDLKLADNSVGTRALMPRSVTAENIYPHTISKEKIANGAIDTAALGNAAVTSEKLAAGSVTNSKIGDGSVTSGKLENGAVTTVKIGESSVTAAKLQSGAVVTAKLAAGAVTTEKLAPQSVTTEILHDGSVGLAKLTNMSPVNAGKVLSVGATGDVVLVDVGSGGGVLSVNGKSGIVSLTSTDIPSTFAGLSVQQVLNNVYPVGAIFISVVNNSPASVFGGVWERILDRFLLAASGNYVAGSTGGEATHELTISEIPSHDHATGFGWGGATAGGDNYFVTSSIGKTVVANRTTLAGGGTAHNNMPPYLAVFMWKRIE